jgi:hypothetical protein
MNYVRLLVSFSLQTPFLQHLHPCLTPLSNLHTPAPPLKHSFNQLPHPSTCIIFLSRHRAVRKPYLSALQIRLCRPVKECFCDERLLLFREGRIWVVRRRGLCGLDLDGECGEAGRAVLGGSCERANVCSRANCTDRFCPRILLGCFVERKWNGGQGHFA